MPSLPGRRSLGRFEQALSLTAEHAPFNLVAVLRLGSPPAPERLREALAALPRRHPLLRARIERRRGGRVFVLDAAREIPLRAVERASEATWRSAVEDELSRPFDRSEAPLARAVCIEPAAVEGPAELILTLEHTLADGASLAALLGEILTSVQGGRTPPPVDPPGLPPPADASFPPAFRGARGRLRAGRYLARQLASELVYRWRTRVRRSPPASPAARCRVLAFALDPATTAALVRRCRRERVTLASAAGAGLLLALLRRRYPGPAGPHRTFVFPDLRPRLRPPVAAGVLASYLSMMRLTVTAGAGTPLWELAARINHQVAAAGRRGERFLSALAAPALMRGALRLSGYRMGTVALNYAGAVDLGQAAGEPRLEGLHAFVSNLYLGPELTAQARLFAGRLCWDLVYLDEDMDAGEARATVDELRGLLTATGEAAPVAAATPARPARHPLATSEER